MLNQKQVKPVKSSLYSKKLKSFLVGNFIKPKLYLLILLTATTGGIVIVPELVPPVQAGVPWQELPGLLQQFERFVLPTSKLFDGHVRIPGRSGRVILECLSDAEEYGELGAGLFVLLKQNGEWGSKYVMRHGDQIEVPVKSGLRYKVQRLDGKGDPTGELIEGVFEEY
ncbi:hypothetical protein CDG76_28350 [Nostoc sp. 'Peltigera membranacea cyanobiont' 210A]|uniref:hypothetical protein n=1 Tax=Nostoc sp. 'Peltigera membranacea cyanobiont' 210A TaxID=2014529 RepID=UPI000B9511C1|nr:hypothetical protein [Nostoc sp. 'Peltigera membranacea cyanobiont' 210A]OYD91164.1 hypothetical protein CDG76_28350 [Nostoc sp. 'Peltigera membranacea cyanobiont' 210A]